MGEQDARLIAEDDEQDARLVAQDDERDARQVASRGWMGNQSWGIDISSSKSILGLAFLGVAGLVTTYYAYSNWEYIKSMIFGAPKAAPEPTPRPMEQRHTPSLNQDPARAAPLSPEVKEVKPESNFWLYFGIGVAALVILGLVAGVLIYIYGGSESPRKEGRKRRRR